MTIGFFQNILFGNSPSFHDVREWDGKWYPDGGTLGTLIIASPGRGKTWLVAIYLLWLLKNVPRASVFVLDWSGDLSNKLLYLIALEPYIERERLIRRVVYDELGHQRYVLPTPEFSPIYGASNAEQIERVKNNWKRLNEIMSEKAPIIAGMAITGLSPMIMEAITSVNWQITEFPRLLDSPKTALRGLLNSHINEVPQQVREWLMNRYVDLDRKEHELRSYALSDLTGAILSPASIVKLGASTPAYTPQEIIDNSGILLFNGSNLINQEGSQHYLFTQAHSLIMQAINKRVPSDPTNSPVFLVYDEAYSIISNPGIAGDIGRIQSLYRSRNIRPIVVIQSLSQLAEPLDVQIWNMGTKIIGMIENFDEVYKTAQQIFKYRKQQEKSPPVRENTSPIYEPDRGQYLQLANYLQHMKAREFFVKRFLSEANEDPFVRHITKTPDVPQLTPEESVASIKERLLRLHGKPNEEVIETIRGRQVITNLNSNPQQIRP